MKDNDLENYLEKVFSLLMGMKPGDSLVIKDITKPETRDLFVESVKYYMRIHEWQDELSFSNGFDIIKKYDLAFIKRQKTKGTRQR